MDTVVSALFLFAQIKPTGRKTGKENKMEENTVSTQTGEGTAPQEGKTFTQEEVNRIVQERLARVKAEPSGKEELNNRERDLNTRELKLKAREMFTEKGLPAELMDILDYSDETKMKKSIEILEKACGRRPKTGGYTPKAGATNMGDPIREAMGLNR